MASTKFLLFARRLALLTPTLAGCASSTSAPASNTIAPPPTTTATTATTEAQPPESGPCRCSWESDASAAPRVCKKGETNHAGEACIPKSHPKYPDMVEGPLPPPDLAVQSQA